jgi:LemA family
VLIYNGLVRRRNQVDNAWSQIDVQLKRRYDLIPNLVETVKGYASHDGGPWRRSPRRGRGRSTPRGRRTRPRLRTPSRVR